MSRFRCRPLFTALSPLLLLLASGSGAVTAQAPPAFDVIVVFDATAQLDPLATAYRPDERAAANPAGWGYLDRGVAGFVQSLERRGGFRAREVYSAAIRGFAARLSARQIRDLQDDPAVAYIERDGVMMAVQQTLPWGVDRIDADLSPTGSAGDGSGAVTGVAAYVIDTGIDAAHADLNVDGHVNFVGGPNTDCNGHGTHVAGTIGARDNASDVVGVAPGILMVGVKVLGCNGRGSTSGVIKGVDWVTAHAVRPAVANLSLGGGASTALDQAVVTSSNSGIFYAVAAGNEGADACTTSPARAGAGVDNGIMTTAATDSSEQEASWSNFGACVDIWAPGVSVVSTRRGGGTITFSGTSMAAPHVAGAAALFFAAGHQNPPAEVEYAIKYFAQAPGTVSKDGAVIKRLWVAYF